MTITVRELDQDGQVVTSRQTATQVVTEQGVDEVRVVAAENVAEVQVVRVYEGLTGDKGDKGDTGDEGPEGPGLDGDEVTMIVESSILSHEIDPAPHPAYDDLPSFKLLFENGLI